MNTLLQLQAATKQARAKTGAMHIGTRVKAGLVDVVRAVPSDNGAHTVTVLCVGLTPAQAVAHLNGMGSE